LSPDLILKLKCTKFDFDRGSAPDPAGDLTVLPRLPRWILRRPASKGGEERERQRKGEE